MTEIKIVVTGANAKACKNGPLTVGMVGVPVIFEFSPEWVGLNIIPVFACGSVTKDNYLTDNRSEVPYEVLAESGQELRIGVEGRSIDGDVVIPTTWAKVGRVFLGAKAVEDPALAPTPSQYDRIWEKLNAIEKYGLPPNWNAAEEEPGHILNRTHWAEVGLVEILPEHQITITDDGFELASNAKLTVGESYIVNWNGVEYTCTAQDFSIAVDGAVAVGDCSQFTEQIPDATGNGEPFVIVVVSGVGIAGFSLDGSTEVTFAIYQDGEIVHKLDNKYLDLEWLPVMNEVQLAAEKTVTNTAAITETTGGFPDLTIDMVCEGMPLIVYLDGVRYETVVEVNDSDTEDEMTVAGVTNGDNALFLLIFASTKTVVIFDDAESHVMSVYTPEHNKMPVEFLPESIGAVKTVNGAAPDENGNVQIEIPEQQKITVNGIAPDENGNVEVQALPNDAEQLSMLIEADMLPAVHDANGAILTDENGNVILRY